MEKVTLEPSPPDPKLKKRPKLKLPKEKPKMGPSRPYSPKTWNKMGIPESTYDTPRAVVVDLEAEEELQTVLEEDPDEGPRKRRAREKKAEIKRNRNFQPLLVEFPKKQYPVATNIMLDGTIIFNRRVFKPIPGAPYRWGGYRKIAEQILMGEINEVDAYRQLCRTDLWFLTYFILGNAIANDPKGHWVRMCRMVDEGPRNLTLDLWAREHGKAVDCEYPILTTDGWKRHRDVEVGDFVYGPEGDARRVIATSETFETECYEVTFNDGSSVVCSGNHLWEVGTGSSAWTSVMSTEELFLEHDDYDYPVKQNIAAQGVPSKEYSYAYITSIKEVPTIPTNCLQVEAEDGLYLIGESFITTHNSTILTENRTVQDLLVDSSRTIVIFSYTKVAAEVFARNTRNHFEMNDDLKALFPDIIWEKPHHKVTWGDSGFTLRRPYTQRECSVEPWGLLEGMPTGRHFKIRRYDDISTFDLAQSPTSLQKMKEAFAMSMNVGGDGDEVMVTGTPYHHDDVLMDLRKQVRRDGSPLFTTRVVPATHDGTIDGEPVYLSDDRIELLKQNRKFFNSQQLLDPTPSHEIKLPYSMINMIRADQVPNDILKVMVIDPAGLKNKDKWRQDAWAMWVVGMQRNILDHGSFNIYILDGLIARLRHEEMARAVVNLYTRNMPIRLIGIEKVGASSAEIHVSNALRSKGHMVTIENGRMRAIHPKGSKTIRIESLAVPLYNGAVFMVDSIQDETRSTLREEMEKFPAWHDDGLDSLAMAYELFKDPQFSQVATRRGVAQGKKPPPDPYETGTSLGQATSINWMAR